MFSFLSGENSGGFSDLLYFCVRNTIYLSQPDIYLLPKVSKINLDGHVLVLMEK